MMFFGLFQSCAIQRNFYFEDIKPGETKVYLFENDKDEKDRIYWKIKASNKNDTLVTFSYNSEFHLNNEFYEKINNKGSKLVKFINYYVGIEGPIIANIIDQNVFSWNTDKPLSYKINFKVNHDEIEMVKTRTFISYANKFYKNKETKVKQFEDRYSVTLNNEKLEDSVNVSYYAKGVGIIQFNIYSQNQVSNMVLKKVLTENEFEEMVKK